MFLSEDDMLMHKIICKNSHTLRELLIINTNEKGYLQENPKEYYIATVLDEMIRFATSMIRWEDDFKDGFDEEKVNTLVGNLIIQGLNNEINMYHRKFIEALTNIVLWKHLNNDCYIKYYFLMKEFNECEGNIKDLKDFYGIHPSIIQNKKLDQVKSLIVQTSSNIDEIKCFFINLRRNPIDINGARFHLSESSFREKLKKALALSDELDKILLGFSYEHYSYTSDKIHFSAKSYMIPSEILAITIRFVFVIINRIISTCGEMLEVSNLEGIGIFDKAFDKVKSSISWYTPILKDIYDIDDYVFTIDGKLGRITDKLVSQYGYRSYKIHFLDDNGEGLSEDYFPAQEFKRIQPKKDLYNKVFEIQPQLKKLYDANPNEEKLMTSLDESMKLLWRITLKKKLTGKM